MITGPFMPQAQRRDLHNRARGLPAQSLAWGLWAAGMGDRLRDTVAAERPASAPAPVLDALLQQVVVDRPPEQAAEEYAALFASVGRTVDAAELLDSPFLLYARTPEDAAAELVRRRDRYGITSWATHSASGPALAEVAAQFR